MAEQYETRPCSYNLCVGNMEKFQRYCNNSLGLVATANELHDILNTRINLANFDDFLDRYSQILNRAESFLEALKPKVPVLLHGEELKNAFSDNVPANLQYYLGHAQELIPLLDNNINDNDSYLNWKESTRTLLQNTCNSLKNYPEWENKEVCDAVGKSILSTIDMPLLRNGFITFFKHDEHFQKPSQILAELNRFDKFITGFSTAQEVRLYSLMSSEDMSKPFIDNLKEAFRIWGSTDATQSLVSEKALCRILIISRLEAVGKRDLYDDVCEDFLRIYGKPLNYPDLVHFAETHPNWLLRRAGIPDTSVPVREFDL